MCYYFRKLSHNPLSPLLLMVMRLWLLMRVRNIETLLTVLEHTYGMCTGVDMVDGSTHTSTSSVTTTFSSAGDGGVIMGPPVQSATPTITVFETVRHQCCVYVCVCVCVCVCVRERERGHLYTVCALFCSRVIVAVVIQFLLRLERSSGTLKWHSRTY